MTWISKTTTFFGLVLLAHACYSAQEHSALQSFRTAAAAAAAAGSPLSGSASPTASTAAAAAAVSLPLDISLETLAATAIVCLGLALGTAPLRPIQWRVWAGKVEREGPEGFRDAEGDVGRDYVGNPFRALESRPGFVDVRRQRREFAEWVRHGNGGGGEGETKVVEG